MSRHLLGSFVHIGERLREERERLGQSQTDFGVSAGVGRKSQFNYESGERLPDAAYLTGIAAMGADVLYVLTGSRDYVPTPPLSAAEQELLDLYRRAPTAVKHAALGALLGAAAKTRGDTHVTFNAKVGQSTTGDSVNYISSGKQKKKPSL